MGRNRFFLILTLTSVLLLPNCSTLLDFRSEPVSVTSSPAPSTVSVNGKARGLTPIEIKLGRRRSGQVIRIESPGYFPFEIQVGGDTTGPNLFTSAIVGAVIGGLVALAEKTWEPHSHLPTKLAIYVPVGTAALVLADLMPHEEKIPRSKELLVSLTKAEGTPRVDTISISADDFQRIKWIRVHRD